MYRYLLSLLPPGVPAPGRGAAPGIVPGIPQCRRSWELPAPKRVCTRRPTAPGRQVPWAVCLEHESCLSSNARHKLVESCGSTDAFLDIHSSYLASGKGKEIAGTTSFCVGGRRERIIGNRFIEGTLTCWF